MEASVLACPEASTEESREAWPRTSHEVLRQSLVGGWCEARNKAWNEAAGNEARTEAWNEARGQAPREASTKTWQEASIRA